MIQLNLLPDVKKEFVNAQKTKKLVIGFSTLATIVVVGLTVLFYMYVTFGQQFQISLINNDIKSRTSTLNGIKDLSKYLTIQNQLQALPTLRAQEGTYSRLFDFLPALNPSAPNSVSLTSLQLQGDSDQLTLSGTTATFESLNVFVDTLRNAQISYTSANSSSPTTTSMFSNITVQNSDLAIVSGKTEVSFTVVATYSSTIFDETLTNVKAVIPNIQTSQSVTGTPVFNQSGQ